MEKEEKEANKELREARVKYNAYRKRRRNAMKKTKVYQEFCEAQKNFGRKWTKTRRAKLAMERAHPVEPMIVLEKRIVDVDQEGNPV